MITVINVKISHVRIVYRFVKYLDFVLGKIIKIICTIVYR